MPRLTIDGREIEVDAGESVLAAARRLGIAVPAMCHLAGDEPPTSCMVCLVENRRTGGLIPSCAAPAADGMVIDTAGDRVRQARRAALELLLSEHVGDCEGPCRRGCPARVPIPGIVRGLAAGRDAEALAELRGATALAAVVCRICPAPCERACRRARVDEGVSVRLLNCALAGEGAPTGPVPPTTPGRGRVAIVGAGPAGLAAAFHLLGMGYACTVFDCREQPGGMLRYGVEAGRLPRELLDAEIDVIRRMGAEFRMNVRVGRNLQADEIERDYGAVILAPGHVAPDEAAALGLEATGDGATFRTGRPRVFAGGDVLGPARKAARAVFHGRAMACSVDQLLSGAAVSGPPKRFDSALGGLQEGELDELMKAVPRFPRTQPAAPSSALSHEEAVREAARCMRCDCRKADACRLRDLCTEYGARQPRYKAEARRKVELVFEHPEIVYEPGKCIRCGACVRIARREGERLGLALVGRGYDVRVGVPFGETLDRGLEKSAAAVVRGCPTGAFSFRDGRP